MTDPAKKFTDSLFAILLEWNDARSEDEPDEELVTALERAAGNLMEREARRVNGLPLEPGEN